MLRDGLSLWTEADHPLAKVLPTTFGPAAMAIACWTYTAPETHAGVGGQRLSVDTLLPVVPRSPGPSPISIGRSFRISHHSLARRPLSALTYQELFDRMTRFVGDEHAEYMAYLRDRYWAGVINRR